MRGNGRRVIRYRNGCRFLQTETKVDTFRCGSLLTLASGYRLVYQSEQHKATSHLPGVSHTHVCLSILLPNYLGNEFN